MRTWVAILAALAICLCTGCHGNRAEHSLLRAAAMGDSPKVAELLSKGVNVDCQDSTQARWTPLLWAVYEDKKDVVQLLLKSGANPKYRDATGHSALELAKSPEVVRDLISAGADTATVDHYYRSLPPEDPGRKAYERATRERK